MLIQNTEQAQKLGKDASENLNILNKNFQKIFKSRNKRFSKVGQSKILKMKSF